MDRIANREQLIAVEILEVYFVRTGALAEKAFRRRMDAAGIAETTTQKLRR